jgi:glucose-6-phosphate isomerase
LTVVTTGDEGPLRELADAEDLPTLAVPEGVPGRFSALSAVGLVPPAILGVDIEGVVEGAAVVADDLGPSLHDTPAYAYGAVLHELEQEGAAVNAVMPYAERLESFAEWLAQLFAESLGKEGQGQTPVRALGATDQHSQIQLYRAGPKDKVVTFVRPGERPDLPIPSADHEALSYLDGVDLGELIDAEYEATVASLPAADRPAIELEIDRLDPQGVGELLYAMEAACVLMGELADVETFTQPAVEWGKRATRALIQGESTEETAVVDERTTHVID